MTALERVGTAAGGLLVLGYAVPLFVPPPAAWPAVPTPDALLWERLFPGVPPGWIVARLGCLLAGAALLAVCAGHAAPLDLPVPWPGTRTRGGGAAEKARWGALLLALGAVVAALYAGRFDRRAEVSFVVLLFAPAVLLAFADARERPSRAGAARPSSLAATLLPVPLLWLCAAIPTAWRSPRAASVVDMWLMLQRFGEALLGTQRVLADSATPGHTNAYMMLEGIALLDPEQLPLAFVHLQVAHAVWAAVCALAIGAVTCRMVARPAGPVAQAAFLFSPFVLSAPYSPGFILIAPLCTATLLLLLLAVRGQGSTAALAAFGIVAGFSGTEPTVVLNALLLCGLAAVTVGRWRPVPWRAVATALACAVAARLPGLPGPAAILEMTRQYAFGQGRLAAIVEILFGQRTPHAVRDAMMAGSPPALDVPLGALLSPFAIARTPMRLLGDSLLEPAGTILMTVGLVACLRRGLRDRAGLVLLALIAAGLAHALTASGDAVSHTRLVAALVPFCILAGSAFEGLRRTLAARRAATIVTGATVAAIAATGLVLFAHVTPRLLPASALAIGLEAVGTRTPNAEATVVEDVPAYPYWLHTQRITSLLPAHPWHVITPKDLQAMDVPASGGLPRVLLWSPAMEADFALSRLVCQRWPHGTLYTLWDSPRLYRMLAAAPAGERWQPQLSGERWSMSSCDDRGATQGRAGPRRTVTVSKVSW